MTTETYTPPTTYTAARELREDAYRELGHAVREVECERRRADAYGAIAIAAGGAGWQQTRSDSCASRRAEAERRADEAGRAYDIACVEAHCALIYDGRHDALVREGCHSADGEHFTPAVSAAMRARAEVLGLDWGELRAGYLDRQPERDAAHEARVQRKLALAGRLGREAQKAAQREDGSWRGAGHTIPA